MSTSIPCSKAIKELWENFCHKKRYSSGLGRKSGAQEKLCIKQFTGLPPLRIIMFKIKIMSYLALTGHCREKRRSIISNVTK